MDEELKNLLEDMQKLQERINKYLERQNNDIPVIPPIVDPLPPQPYNPDRIVAKCGQCGLEMKEVMGYVCPQPRCPTGLGGPTCFSTSIEGKLIC